MGKRLITKEAPTGRQWVDASFKQASELEIKEMAGIASIPDGYCAGWASTEDRDWYGHSIRAGAFDESINTKGFVGPKGIRLLLQHDRDKVAGVIKSLRTVGSKLWIEAQLNLQIGYVKDFYLAALDAGGLNFSVGFFVEDAFDETKDGQSTWVITKGDLEEVSLVTFPGNPEAVMTFLKDRGEEIHASLPDFERYLMRSGIAQSRNIAAKLTLAVKRNLHLFTPPKPPTAPVASTTLENLQKALVALKEVLEG